MSELLRLRDDLLKLLGERATPAVIAIISLVIAILLSFPEGKTYAIFVLIVTLIAILLLTPTARMWFRRVTALLIFLTAFIFIFFIAIRLAQVIPSPFSPQQALCPSSIARSTVEEWSQ